MDFQPRLESLTRQRAAVDAALHEEEAHAYHDEKRIHDLKLKKLHLKEQIFLLQTAANHNDERTR